MGNPKFPYVDILMVPRHFLHVAVPANPEEAAKLPPNTLILGEIPSLSARPFKVRLDFSDYDLRAPSVEFRDFWTDQPLQYSTMFRAVEYEEQRKAHVVLLDDHPTTHRPFLCIRGVREYHEHPQHSGDDWLLYRKSMQMFSIVMAIWRVSVDLVRPLLIPQAGGFQVQWNTEEKR